MLINKEVVVRWHHANKEHYINKGYKFTKYGDEITVKIKDLSLSNKVLVEVKCDYCGKVVKRKYCDYIKQNETVNKDACKGCWTLKYKDVCLAKYGVDNVNMLESTKQKKIETCRANYGVDHPAQSKEITERMKQSRKDNLGYEWAMQNPEVRRKTKQALFDNDTGACSKPQRYLCYLLDGKLNYPIDNCSVDILLDDNIIIEYDGGGHDLNVQIGAITQKEFDNNERKRDYFLKSQGYKVIRIISPRDYIPPDEKIIELVNEAIRHMSDNNANHYNIKFGNKMIDKKYGQLRRISEKDIEIIESKKGSFLIA